MRALADKHVIRKFVTVLLSCLLLSAAFALPAYAIPTGANAPTAPQGTKITAENDARNYLISFLKSNNCYVPQYVVAEGYDNAHGYLFHGYDVTTKTLSDGSHISSIVTSFWYYVSQDGAIYDQIFGEYYVKAAAADYSKAYAAYAEVLKANKTNILAYDWQVGPNMSYNSGLAIALCNICGDDTPELIFMAAHDDGIHPIITADLIIYTYKDGKAVNIYWSTLDHAIAGGTRWMLFEMPGSNDMYIFTSFGDMNWDNNWYHIELHPGGWLTATSDLREEITIDEIGPNHELHEYFLDEKKITSSAYMMQVSDYVGRMDTLILFSDGAEEHEIDSAISKFGTSGMMTYDEALYLLTGGKEGAVTFMLPQSDSRYYTEAELAKFSDYELFIARNEIYARHGRMFSSSVLQEYFSHCVWYTPKYAPDVFDSMPDVLNAYENANISLILKVEKARGSKYV